MNVRAAHYVTMHYFRERAVEGASYHRELGNYLAKTEREIIAEQRRWLEAC